MFIPKSHRNVFSQKYSAKGAHRDLNENKGRYTEDDQSDDNTVPALGAACTNPSIDVADYTIDF